jgi:hypothetical protein
VSPCCECGGFKDRRAMGCLRCMEIDQQRYMADSPRRKILRFLAANDWVEAVDLIDTFDPVNRAEFSSVVSWLVKDGLVERRKLPGQRFEYRFAQQQKKEAA